MQYTDNILIEGNTIVDGHIDCDGAVVATVHDLNQVHRFATHVLLLGESGVLAQGAREQVMRSETLSRAFGVEVALDENGRVFW